jgi:hypothetical protein
MVVVPHALVDYKSITSPYVDYNTFTTGDPMVESTLTLRQSRFYPPIRDFGISLCPTEVLPSAVCVLERGEPG